MRRSPEIVILIVLLAVMVVGVLWYVFDRRAKNRAAPVVVAPSTQIEKPAPTPTPLARPVGVVPVISTPTGPMVIPDGKTLDFSSGRAVVKDTPEDRAAMAKALKEMEEAARTVKFDALPQPKKTPPTAVPPDKP